jgi:hypothetical protein
MKLKKSAARYAYRCPSHCLPVRVLACEQKVTTLDYLFRAMATVPLGASLFERKHQPSGVTT